MLEHQNSNFCPNLLYLIFEVVNFASYCGTSEIKGNNMMLKKRRSFYRLKDILTPNFSTPSINPWPFNLRLFNHKCFNPRLFNHELFISMVQKFMVEKFMVEKSGVERSGVEKSSTFMQFWRSYHMNKLNWWTPQDI